MVILSILLLWLACQPQPSTSMKSSTNDDDASRIRELDNAWAEAARRRDLDGMLAIYAPDAQELLPGSPAIVGREDIRHFYQNLMEQLPRFAHHFEPQSIIVAESRDLAVVRGRFRFTPDTLRPETVQAGKFVGVWRRRQGEWQLLLNISNSDQPAP
jgi:uncharacterized protein (TIGR02246 family)